MLNVVYFLDFGVKKIVVGCFKVLCKNVYLDRDV